MPNGVSLEDVAAAIDTALASMVQARRMLELYAGSDPAASECQHEDRAEVHPGEWYCLNPECGLLVGPPEDHGVSSGTPETPGA